LSPATRERRHRREVTRLSGRLAVQTREFVAGASAGAEVDLACQRRLSTERSSTFQRPPGRPDDQLLVRRSAAGSCGRRAPDALQPHWGLGGGVGLVADVEQFAGFKEGLEAGHDYGPAAADGLEHLAARAELAVG